MGRVCELWRRLRTFLPPEKPPSTAPLWEVMEGSAPDTNTGRRPLARHANGRQQTAHSKGALPASRSQATCCMQGGWSGRAPS